MLLDLSRSYTEKGRSNEGDLNHFREYILMMFLAYISFITAISWRPVLVVEEAGVPGENHRPWASNWETLSLAAASRVHPFL
jgi:hypothetical protein